MRRGADGDAALLRHLLGVDEVHRLRQPRREHSFECGNGEDTRQSLIDTPEFDSGARDRTADNLRGEEAEFFGHADERRGVGVGQTFERQVHGGDENRAA